MVCNQRFERRAGEEWLGPRDGGLQKGANQMAQGGPVGLNNLPDRPANQDRIGAVLFILLDHGERRLEIRTIGGVFTALGRQLPRGGKAGCEIARLDDCDADSGTAQLHAQRFAIALEREFGGAVHALEWNGDQARDRADDDDVGALPDAQMGQSDAAHPVVAEEIRLELREGLIRAGVLQGATEAHAGVADHDVQAAFTIDQGADGRRDRRIVIDVHLDHLEGAMGTMRARHFPRRAVNEIARSVQNVGDRKPQTRTRPRDQRHSSLVHHAQPLRSSVLYRWRCFCSRFRVSGKLEPPRLAGLPPEK
jgi:hypothetical protein